MVVVAGRPGLKYNSRSAKPSGRDATAFEKIPAAKLEKAAKSDNPTLARRANLAKTLKGFNK